MIYASVYSFSTFMFKNGATTEFLLPSYHVYAGCVLSCNTAGDSPHYRFMANFDYDLTKVSVMLTKWSN